MMKKRMYWYGLSVLVLIVLILPVFWYLYPFDTQEEGTAPVSPTSTPRPEALTVEGDDTSDAESPPPSPQPSATPGAEAEETEPESPASSPVLGMLVPFSRIFFSPILSEAEVLAFDAFEKMVKVQIKEQHAVAVQLIPYPENVQPFSREIIEDAPPITIDPRPQDNPATFLAKLGTEQQVQRLLLGHIEEDYLEGKGRLYLGFRVFLVNEGKFDENVSSIKILIAQDRIDNINAVVEELVPGIPLSAKSEAETAAQDKDKP